MANTKQIIIVRKDLNMSKGKMAAQVSHASMAFLTYNLRNSAIQINENTFYNPFYFHVLLQIFIS